MRLTRGAIHRDIVSHIRRLDHPAKHPLAGPPLGRPQPRRARRPGRRRHHALAPTFVRTAPPGHHIDGHGLYLYVQPTGARSWIQRLVIRGRRCELGLGAVALVSLAEAREKALANRKLAREGGDPLADKRRAEGVPTFADATTAVIEQQRTGWKNPEQVRAWRNSLERYAFPRIGWMTVSAVASADVLAILAPIWHTTSRLSPRRSGSASTRCWSGPSP